MTSLLSHAPNLEYRAPDGAVWQASAPKHGYEEKMQAAVFRGRLFYATFASLPP